MGDTIERDVEIDEKITVRSEDDTDPVSTAAIHADIRQTRERMGHTLDHIGDRLHPDNLKEQVKDNVREATIGRAEDMARDAKDRVNEARHSIMDTIRDNPLPAALAGIGLGWLVWNGRSDDSYDGRKAAYGRRRGGNGSYYTNDLYARDAYSEGRSDGPAGTAGDFADRTRDAAGEAVDRTQEAVASAASRARATAGQIADETRYRTHRIEDRLEGALHESPLAVGAAAMALGLAAGFVAPATRKESEFMGEARDHFVERAQEVAEETTDKVQRVAGRVTDEAESTAGEAAREQNLTT